MLANSPAVDVAARTAHPGALAVPLLAGFALAVLALGLSVMGAPAIASASTTVVLGALLWLRARLARGVA